MDNLNEKLKQLRINKHATQKEVAEYCGVATTSIQRFEYGTNKPSIENIIKLAEFFNVSSDYLLGISDNPTRH